MKTNVWKSLWLGGVCALLIGGGIVAHLLTNKQQSLASPPISTPTPSPNWVALADLGEHIYAVQELTVQIPASLETKRFPRLVTPFTDGKTLIGVLELGGSHNAVVAIALPSGAMKVLADNEVHGYHPQVAGQYVVWESLRELYAYDLTTDVLMPLDLGNAGHTMDLQITGQTAIWKRYTDEAFSFMQHDFATGQTSEIVALANSPKGYIKVFNDWVMYTHGLNSTSTELRIINLTTQEDIYLAALVAGTMEMPYMSKRYIIGAQWAVWAEYGSLHFFNTQTKTTHKVATCAGETPRLPSDLTISEDILLFSCGSTYAYDIRQDIVFDLPIRRTGTDEVDFAKYGFEEWSLVNERLIWVLTEYDEQVSQSHIYSAYIQLD